MTESRIEAVFDVVESRTLSDEQRDRLLNRLGARVDAVAQDARSQARNRELALERLAEKIATGLQVERERRPTRPTRSSREKRLESKRRRSQTKRRRGGPGPGDWD